MFKQMVLVSAVSLGLTVLVLLGTSSAIPCTGDAQTCHHAYGDGSCCMQITSIPELIPHNHYGPVANWTNLPGGVNCGALWTKVLLWPCYYPDGSTCGGSQASPDCGY